MPCKNGLQWAAMGGRFRNYPPPVTKIAMYEWAAMGWSGRTFQELAPWLKLPCKSGLQWAVNERIYEELTPWIKLPGKSGLQWGAMGGFFRKYHPDWNYHVRVGCNGGLFRNYSPDWICHVRVRFNGLQREDFSGITPLTEVAMHGWAALGCNGRFFEELPPPRPKLPSKSGLQWAALGDFSGITP